MVLSEGAAPRDRAPHRKAGQNEGDARRIPLAAPERRPQQGKECEEPQRVPALRLLDQWAEGDDADDGRRGEDETALEQAVTGKEIANSKPRGQ